VAKLKVMCARSMHVAVGALGEAFAKAGGHEVTFDFGLTLSGEVASVPGAAIAGPLPPPYGLETVYCAAVVAGSTQKEAASAFIAALTAPRTRETWTRAGFEVA
jgi:molybdate transport system substrate-binding protein